MILVRTLGLIALISAPAMAQSIYPSRPLCIIVL